MIKQKRILISKNSMMIRIKIKVSRTKVRNNNNLAISSQKKMITMMMIRNKIRNRKQ